MKIQPHEKEFPTYFLYGQSTLRKFGIKFRELENIAPLILKTRLENKFRIIDPISNFEDHVEQIRDICEKLDFLRVSSDTINFLEKHLRNEVYVIHVEEVKFFFYMFIFNQKSLMDSISMLLRTTYDIKEFKKGNIDIIRKEKYRDAISVHSPIIGDFLNKHTKWANDLLKYRDILIHRHGIPIFVKDEVQNAIFIHQRVRSVKGGYVFQIIHLLEEAPKMITWNKKNGTLGSRNPFKYVFFKQPITLSELLLRKRKSSEDFISISEYCKKSFSFSKQFIEVVFRELYSKLTS